jgi:hypothetical protein
MCHCRTGLLPVTSSFLSMDCIIMLLLLYDKLHLVPTCNQDDFHTWVCTPDRIYGSEINLSIYLICKSPRCTCVWVVGLYFLLLYVLQHMCVWVVGLYSLLLCVVLHSTTWAHFHSLSRTSHPAIKKHQQKHVGYPCMSTAL